MVDKKKASLAKMTSTENHEFQTHNEFRSDTFTVPTNSMLEAVKSSTFGDSVYNEDENTLQLEDKLSKLTGKEAALFCVSGTMTNQIGIRVNLCQPPYSVLCDHRSHIYENEAAGLATLSQAMVTPVVPKNGLYLTLEDVQSHFVPDDGDIHAAPTKVISLENTLYGIIMPLEEIQRISDFARKHGARIHLDGARLWNASTETGVSIKEYCSNFDSVSLCLSKSLGAPIGSVLVGDKSFIRKANHFRKQSGGGIRQSGMLALMAMISIDENWSKLAYSHKLAKEVADFCVQKGIHLLWPADTNFVFVDLAKCNIDSSLMSVVGKKHNVNLSGCRMAFHFQLSKESIQNLKAALLECFEIANSTLKT